MNDRKPQLELLMHSPDETYQLGLAMGGLMPAAMILGLTGTLGTGKTRLTQGIIAGTSESEKTVVVSPTFTICIPYKGRVGVLHLDAYRIADDDEVFELGLDEAVDDGNVLIVEWVEKIRGLLPWVDLEIEIEHVDETTRKFDFFAPTPVGLGLIEQLSQARGFSSPLTAE